MKIETPYEIGNDVYIVIGNNIHCLKVIELRIHVKMFDTLTTEGDVIKEIGTQTFIRVQLPSEHTKRSRLVYIKDDFCFLTMEDAGTYLAEHYLLEDASL